MIHRFSTTSSISRMISAIIVVIIIVIAGVAAYGASISSPPRQTSDTSTSLSQTTTTSASLTTTTSHSTSSSSSPGGSSVPSVFTWETANTIENMDPDYSYGLYDFQIMQNVYEPLFYYNGSCSTCVIPWLVQNYTVSPDSKTYTFTLRSGISFADCESLNTTAVYFSLNRLLIADGSSTSANGVRAAWIIQQMLNTSLSSQLCGCKQSYDASYVNDVLAENFVQATGPMTFTMHIQHPNTAFPYLMSGEWATILAPEFVMQHDLAIWSQPSNGYNLPYPNLTGTLSNQISQYYLDLVSTCETGITPNGCGLTYLSTTTDGSQAGTGPYTIQSISPSSNDIVLKANPNYWGGPNQFTGGSKIIPRIGTIDINFVPSISTREIDLTNAAASGQAMSADVSNDHLYDVANRSAWTTENVLSSTIPGVTIYGPQTSYTDIFDLFSLNVTNYFTGKYNTFQPFADIRFRQAFADAINVTEFNIVDNNNLGQVETSAIPPGLPPAGSYNASITPKYKYDPVAVQNLLLDAMMHPLTHFTFVNGTVAPTGVFNNTFGCPQLNSAGQCSHPVSQTLTLNYPTGWYETQSLLTIANVINNVSSTYNMGLTVDVAPEPFGQLFPQADTGSLYMYSAGWFEDYPWVTDYVNPMYYSGGNWAHNDRWNITAMDALYHQAIIDSSTGNMSGLVAETNKMNELANNIVMYLWLFYPATFTVITSNIRGYYYNPSVVGFYFAALY
ncbi:MAG: ABC transporter substrate-binding protein [Thaumarchaeota archaeon]|nr:ABC transporter substrate-binding protein [Nitrososphaerota archaeon]